MLINILDIKTDTVVNLFVYGYESNPALYEFHPERLR